MELGSPGFEQRAHRKHGYVCVTVTAQIGQWPRSKSMALAERAAPLLCGRTGYRSTPRVVTVTG